MLVWKHPDDSNSSSQTPKARLCSPFIVPSLCHGDNLMTSYNDVTIICSFILAGKPLHMCGRTTIVCLHICWHPCQIYQILQRFQTSSSLFQTLFCACDIYIYIYMCVCVCDTLPLDNPKTHSHLALPYITWGLIWDLKIKYREIPIEKIFFYNFFKYKQQGLKQERSPIHRRRIILPLAFKNHQI